MKTLARLTVAALALTSLSAMADFNVGRVRPLESAQMFAVSGTGIYENTESALVTLNYKDGDARPDSITFTLDNFETITVPVSAQQNSKCGNATLAETQTLEGANHAAKLVDYSDILCRMYVANKWHLAIATEINGQESTLKLEGNPQSPLAIKFKTYNNSFHR